MRHLSLFGLAALGAAAALGSMSEANAGLIISPNGNQGGYQATNEPSLDGSPGFPCTVCTSNPVTTFGYTGGSPLPGEPNPPGNPLGAATLIAQTAGTYSFTFEGAGNAGFTNTFSFLGHTFTAVGPGATGAGSTPDGTTFTVSLAANTPIDFTYGSSGGCMIADGGTAAAGCNYLIALGSSMSSPGALGWPQNTAWIGLSDGGSTADHDFQDLTVLVRTPEPASMALLGSGLVSLAFAYRRKARKLNRKS